jgi:hypothetical protein
VWEKGTPCSLKKTVLKFQLKKNMSTKIELWDFNYILDKITETSLGGRFKLNVTEGVRVPIFSFVIDKYHYNNFKILVCIKCLRSLKHLNMPVLYSFIQAETLS